VTRDDLTTPWHADPEAAEELLALPKASRARKAGRSYVPSVHARPLPGGPGVPTRLDSVDVVADEECAP
jgi:hypothetical protein